MINTQYSSPLLDQTKDLIWAVDHRLCLVYANKVYLNLVKEVTGKETKFQEPALVEGFGEGYTQKWEGYYKRALSGEQFELEEHYAHPGTNEIKYGQIIFNPVRDKNNQVVAVGCQSRDITRIVKQRSEAHQLMDASLDVFCTVNEAGNFVFVSEAATKHWGYTPQELIGKPYVSFILEDDIPKTNNIANAILNGEEIKSFVNRYKRKDGTIAYNLWSARWDSETKLMYAVARDTKEKIEQETLLHESEQRFKALVQEGADLIAILDSNGNYRYVSPTSITVLGMEPEEFTGKNPFDYIHPEDAEKTLNSLSKIATESRVEVEPFRFKNKNGEWRWIETVLTNMLDNPSVNGIVANSRDITETKNIFNKIAANDQFNKTVIESSPDCLKILDNEGRLIYMNFNGLCQMEIDDFSEFKNKQWGLLWGPENEALVRESVDKALTGETAQFTAFCPTAKGTPKWWDVMVSPVIKTGEPIEKIISISRDITAKKEEEHRLKLLESVITNTNDAVLITEAEPLDEPGPRILYVNEAFTRMTGYTAEEVIGKSPRILQGPKSDMAELARLSKALRNWEPCEITTINYKKNGEEFWVNFSVSPVADETGWYTHWISIERDVTEQKTKEQENELVVQISSTFNLINDFKKATKKLCEIIGLYGKLDWVELWTPNLEMTEMRLISHYVITPEDEIFYTDNYHDNKFLKGEGLIGKVWASGKQILWDDVTKRNEFIRAYSAKKIGLKSVLGIPLIFNNKVLGVLTVGVKSNSDYLKNYTRIFERLEKFIGSELQRKTLEIELGLLFDTIPDIISVGDFKGKFLRINKPGCELLGYNEEEILQKGFENFIHPEDLNICYKEIQQLQNGQDTFGFEVRFITKSGKILWLSWYCKAKINEGLIYCSAKNITEEKKLRELNRQSRELAKIGSWEVDMIHQSIYWTDEVHQMHETDANSFKPTMEQAVAFYREDFRELVNQSIKNSINTGEPFDFEAVLVTANKKELWVRAIGNAEFVNGNCTSIYGSFQDIHQNKLSELRIKSLANNIPGTIFQYQLFPDGTDKLLHLSKGAEKLWGIDAEVGMKNNALIWDRIIAGGDIDKVQASIGESMNSLENWHVYFRSKLPNGKIKWLEGLGTPNRLSDGSTIWDSIILDVTNLKETEQLLDSASKLARVGSWEIVLQDNEEFRVFWSSMTKNILEIDKFFEPTIANGINFYKEPSRSLMEAAMNNAIKAGEAFDLELEVVTGKGNDVWIRCIGDAQFENGKVTRVYGSFQDINTRKLGELNQLKLIEEKSKILESIGDAFFAVDNEWTVTYWNHVAEKSFQKNKNEIVGKNLWDVYQDSVESDFYTKYHYAMETMETQSFETFYETRNQWLEVTAYPSEDGLSVYFKDITQRKKANEEIAKSEEKRRLIMNGALDAIITIDTNETITFWNPQAEVIFGWKSEKVMGKPLSEIIIPEAFRKYHVEGLKNYLKTGEGKALNVLLELSAIRRNGEEFPIELTVIPIKHGGEEFFCAFVRDITQRKKSEAARIMAEKNYQELFDKSNDAIYVHELDTGQISNVNYRATELTGFDKLDFLEKDSSHLFTDNPEYSMEKALGYVQKAAQGEPQVFEWLTKKKDGTSGWFEMTLKRTSIAGVDKILAFQRDISERKKAEVELLDINQKLNIQTKELQRSNEELEQFAYVASHDLQEPLRMISSFMEQLKRKYSDRLDEKGLQYIHFATDGAKRMKQIILDLLLYSRANRPTEQIELINLNEMVSEYTQLRRKVIAEKSATITYHGLPSIETYRAPITQIFHCLLDNALKYMDKNKPPSIEIGAIEKENVWQFAIKDNGIGIDQKFFDKIFIIFQRLQNRKEHDGTGIGLAVAKRSIEFLGGEIWVESEIDKGSTFYFTISKIKQLI